MAQPSTPSGTAIGVSSSIFGGSAADAAPSYIAATAASSSATLALTPASATSSNNTYVLPNSPLKTRVAMDGYRPKVTRTLGQRPACLVNASVTYCGNNQIYAF